MRLRPAAPGMRRKLLRTAVSCFALQLQPWRAPVLPRDAARVKTRKRGARHPCRGRVSAALRSPEPVAPFLRDLREGAGPCGQDAAAQSRGEEFRARRAGCGTVF